MLALGIKAHVLKQCALLKADNQLCKHFVILSGRYSGEQFEQKFKKTIQSLLRNFEKKSPLSPDARCKIYSYYSVLNWC